MLPFTGLREPQGLSVDLGGTVYVADTMHNRILALSAGANDPAVLPFEGLDSPSGVTADNSGTVYVNDSGNKRVLALPSGSRKQTQLAFTDLDHPTGLTVDSARTVYVTDTAKNQVVALDASSNKQYQLPFNGLNGPTGLVVGASGTLYLADSGNNRVLSLAPGSNAQTTLPFVGLSDPGGVTVDQQRRGVRDRQRGQSRAETPRWVEPARHTVLQRARLPVGSGGRQQRNGLRRGPQQQDLGAAAELAAAPLDRRPRAGRQPRAHFAPTVLMRVQSANGAATSCRLLRAQS